MSTDIAIMMGVDIIAIVLLVFAVYLPRHQRADLVVAFIGVNIGVLGVSLMLADMEVSAGVGLGLFGVLSIIRLRSSEIFPNRGRVFLCSARYRAYRRLVG